MKLACMLMVDVLGGGLPLQSSDDIGFHMTDFRFLSPVFYSHPRWTLSEDSRLISGAVLTKSIAFVFMLMGSSLPCPFFHELVDTAPFVANDLDSKDLPNMNCAVHI